MNQQAFAGDARIRVDPARVDASFPRAAAHRQRALRSSRWAKSSNTAPISGGLPERLRRALPAAGEMVLLPKAAGPNSNLPAAWRGYFKLLAWDEYEVARLYSDGTFQQQLGEQFSGDFSLQFHLGASWARLSRMAWEFDLGPWLLPAFKWLARFKWLRAPASTPFGWQPDRKLGRRLIAKYDTTWTPCSASRRDNLPRAAGIAIPGRKIRGYGHVKQLAAGVCWPTWDKQLQGTISATGKRRQLAAKLRL